MNINLKIAFGEQPALHVLEALSRVNSDILSAQKMPLLYDSGVYYKREKSEVWCDVINMYAQGFEDCDALAAARVGEIRAFGYKAFRPGDNGYKAVMRNKPSLIKARPILTTKVKEGGSGLYHCVLEFRIDNKWYRDDPSARLGMNGKYHPAILKRWKKAGHSLPGNT